MSLPRKRSHTTSKVPRTSLATSPVSSSLQIDAGRAPLRVLSEPVSTDRQDEMGDRLALTLLNEQCSSNKAHETICIHSERVSKSSLSCQVTMRHCVCHHLWLPLKAQPTQLLLQLLVLYRTFHLIPSSLGSQCEPHTHRFLCFSVLPDTRVHLECQLITATCLQRKGEQLTGIGAPLQLAQ